MYGWRGRIAHLAPSRGDWIVYEFYKVAPRGTMLMNVTGTVRNLVDNDLSDRMKTLEAAAIDIAEDKVDLIIAGGSPIVTLQGYGSEKRIAQQLTEACGVPCVTGMELEVDCLHAVGSQRPVLATPYPPALDERLMKYLGQAGFDVQGCKGLGIENNATIGQLPEHAALRAGRQAVAGAPKADAIFMPCGRWPTLDAAVMLEQELGIPVITASLAYCYGSFSRLGIRDEFVGCGSLLGLLRPKSVAMGAL
jgi:maleate isomerase